jgi:DNA-directed RNA polymerase subunit RPC12/RpoP
MRLLNDFVCSHCGTVTEALIDTEYRTIECPECQGNATIVQAMPTVRLEGITGAFPGAADRWARIREDNARVKARRA